MTLLFLRITLAPLLILGGSLAQRRWGPSIGGRLIGLPLTSLPLLLVLDLSDGTHFATGAARASLAGGVAQCIWCLAYVVAARRQRPLTALATATAAFAVACGAIDLFSWSTLAATVVSALAVLASLILWPAPASEVEVSGPARGDLWIRMAIAAVFTLVLTESAASLGAHSAGLVGAFPLLTAVLTVAIHRREGEAVANRFLRGVMAGSFSVVAALAVITIGLPRAGLGLTFVAAVVASLASQWIPTRRPRFDLPRGRSLTRSA